MAVQWPDLLLPSVLAGEVMGPDEEEALRAGREPMCGDLVFFGKVGCLACQTPLILSTS